MTSDPESPASSPEEADSTPDAVANEAAGEGAARPGLAQTGHATRTAVPEPPAAPKESPAAPTKAEKNAPEPAPEHEPYAKDAYVVTLPGNVFEGPLDLLLSIIQKHELNILDLPISFVTSKYLEYLNVMKELPIDVASEYLVMAATLAHIKSKMLLPEVPKDQDLVDEEEEADPRYELVRRLLEYQKYKAAAEDLGNRDTLGNSVFPRGSNEPVPEGPAPFASATVFELLDAFSKVLSRTKVKIEHEVVFDRISISDRITELVDVMLERKSVPFEELFTTKGTPTRFDLVITFLAVLEMCRMNMMRVFQTDSLSPIHVELLVVDSEDAPLKLRTVPPKPTSEPPADDAADEALVAVDGDAEVELPGETEPEPEETEPEPEETQPEPEEAEPEPEETEPTPEETQPTPEETEPEPEETQPEPEETEPEPEETEPEPEETEPEPEEAEPTPEETQPTPEETEPARRDEPEPEETQPTPEETKPEPEETQPTPEETEPEPEETQPTPEETQPTPNEMSPSDLPSEMPSEPGEGDAAVRTPDEGEEP